MGDGHVALILDVMGVAQRSKVISEARHLALAESAAGHADKIAAKQTFLLFCGPDDARMALPLDTLARLGELPTSRVEKSGEQWLTQYRGQLLPWSNLARCWTNRRSELHHPARSGELTEGGLRCKYLCCNCEGQTVGIVVEDIF